MWPFGRVRFEVGRDIANSQTHHRPPNIPNEFHGFSYECLEPSMPPGAWKPHSLL